jgi:hypothetical protein
MGMIHYNRPTTRKKLMAGETPKWISNSPRADYIRRIVLSIPPWQGTKELLQLNATAAWITKMTGMQHHLDHIVPVTHPLVCGLTVPWNLRITPYRYNLAKGNFWCPEQMPLFEDMESEEEALEEYLLTITQTYENMPDSCNPSPPCECCTSSPVVPASSSMQLEPYWATCGGTCGVDSGMERSTPIGTQNEEEHPSGQEEGVPEDT